MILCLPRKFFFDVVQSYFLPFRMKYSNNTYNLLEKYISSCVSSTSYLFSVILGILSYTLQVVNFL